MSKQNFSLIGMPVNDTPVFQEKQGKKWVSYGLGNMYPNYLEFLYLSSSIHSAIVNGVGAMIYGEGLTAENENDQQFQDLVKLLGNSDEDLLRKIALDLKLYGQAYINTIWNRKRTEIAKMNHLPVHTLRSGLADESGNVHEYYYTNDWTDHKAKPVVLQAFSEDDRTEASRVVHIKRYSPSFHYYGVPDYIGSTGYIELDYEIQSFHLNNIKNGLFPSMMMNFNNGLPTLEERREIERSVLNKFQGAKGAGKIMMQWNDGAENATTITPIETNASDEMYEHLSVETSNKILSGHRVTSPLMFGVKTTGGGFGNNADELRDSYSLFTNTVVKPFQDIIIKALKPILKINGIDLELSFKPMKPADFLDTDEKKVDEGLTSHEFSKALNWLELRGEDEDEDYELIDTRRVDYNDEDRQDVLWNFASVPKSSPNTKSEQDNPLIKVRYSYKPDAEKLQKNNREFCSKMVKSRKVYRKEDIIAAGSEVVNKGFGEGGSDTYSIWLFKGGARCRHFWERRTYLRKNNKRISVSEARRLITSLPPNERPDYRIPVNEKEVAQRPVDMPNKGFSPKNKNLPKDAK